MWQLNHLVRGQTFVIIAPDLLYCVQAKKAKVISESCVGKNKRHYLNIIEDFLADASV